jgi:hypothetical protein
MANGVGGNAIGNGANTAAQTINIGSGTNTAGVIVVTVGSNANFANSTTIQGGNGTGACSMT